MELLKKFQAPTLTRLIWHNSKARSTWQDRIEEMGRWFQKIERQSVLHGIKNASLQPLAKHEFPEILAWAVSNGLKMRVVQTVARFDGFAHYYQEGDDYFITAIATTNEMVEDPEKHLGYPTCCVKFYHQHFPRIYDPMWQWAGEQSELGNIPNESNPLLRYMNIRFISHIPCSPNCQESLVIGSKMKALYPQHVADWIDELLSLPTTWDCYRGIVIVKNQDFRIVVGSVPTKHRYLINVNQGKTPTCH